MKSRKRTSNRGAETDVLSLKTSSIAAVLSEITRLRAKNKHETFVRLRQEGGGRGE